MAQPQPQPAPAAANFTQQQIDQSFDNIPAVNLNSDSKLDPFQLNGLVDQLRGPNTPCTGSTNAQILTCIQFFAYSAAIKGATHETDFETTYNALANPADLNDLAKWLHKRKFGIPALCRTFASNIVRKMFVTGNRPTKWEEKGWPEEYAIYAWPGSEAIQNEKVAVEIRLTTAQRQFIIAKHKSQIKDSQLAKIESGRAEVMSFYIGQMASSTAAKPQIGN